MGTYPIKILSDEQGTPFVPLVSLDSVQTPDGEKITDLIDAKMSSEDLIAGQYVVINQEGGKATINVDLPASLNTINNLTTETSGQGALDAYQGKVLKDSIPVLVDSLDSDDANKALSARQGKILGEKLIPDGGSTGQVLKKGDNGYEWGDAADPNAIVGDGSIMSIISLTYAEYKNLEAAGELQEDTEYHITDMGGNPGNSDVPGDPEIVYDPNAISGDGSIKKIIEISYEEYLELEAANQLQDDTEYHINDWNENERTYLTEQDILNITSPHAIMAVIQGGKSSSTILYTLEQYGQVPLQECEQIGNSFSITSDGMIECLRNGYIEVSGKISFQKAEGTDERWLEIRKSDDNYISANPAYFSGRNMIAASPVLHHIKAGEKIQLKIDGVAGDQIRSNKEYSSIYIKYIFFD